MWFSFSSCSFPFFSFDQWLALENAKHGMLHVRLQWYKLTADPSDLQAALLETQLLRVTSMSSALLTVFIDSCKNLKQARVHSKPDPYLVCSVGKQKQQTAMIMRDDSPVWEQGFTFLVSNPENDTLQIRIFDQKTGNEIGQFGYVIAALMNKENMELVSQPFQIQKSGPESKLIMSLSLRILKKAEVIDDPENSEPAQPQLSRTTSVNRTPSIQERTSPKVSPPPIINTISLFHLFDHCRICSPKLVAFPPPNRLWPKKSPTWRSPILPIYSL